MLSGLAVKASLKVLEVIMTSILTQLMKKVVRAASVELGSAHSETSHGICCDGRQFGR